MYGDLSSFSMTSAATDVATFISEHTNGENTTVYGVSYETALVERLMHLDTPTMTGYVLDSIATTSGASAAFPQLKTSNFPFCNPPASLCPQVLTSVLSSSKREPTIATRARSVTELASRPYSNLLGTRHPGYFTEMATSRRAENGTMESFGFVSEAVDHLETPALSRPMMEKRFRAVEVSDGGFYEVDYGGIYKLSPLYCAFSKEPSPVCNEIKSERYPSKGIIYERDEYWNKSAVIPKQASVLLLSGKLDPQTPHKHAEYLFEVLEGDNKELTTFDYATHGIIVSTQLVEEDPSSETCGMRLLASYVKNGGDLARLDKTCVGEMPRFNWKISTDYMYGILGTDEPYDESKKREAKQKTVNTSLNEASMNCFPVKWR
ncbi:uncharacterized protein PITG_21813 [Phytophthora infestans T30-4]|uniref:Serine protease family S33 n=1 Tax=Phytophthora infestans (strain T30-4) TaxID=403677 RepID=D0P4L1_PHYIT|nr:uncharacterized protein PITG_21813 [Phytophthora infestans T30-4]EEY66984.1 conserved hypothetical protein [Phytophthora infestans T30-4]|eukprot:XP_002894763.1 conserved hypothetical protein [Phytophthora infestans T30-4]